MSQVKSIDHRAIFTKAAGHPPLEQKKTITFLPNKRVIAGNIGNR